MTSSHFPYTPLSCKSCQSPLTTHSHGGGTTNTRTTSEQRTDPKMQLDVDDIVEIKEYETDNKGRANFGIDRANKRLKIALIKVIDPDE